MTDKTDAGPVGAIGGLVVIFSVVTVLSVIAVWLPKKLPPVAPVKKIVAVECRPDFDEHKPVVPYSDDETMVRMQIECRRFYRVGQGQDFDVERAQLLIPKQF